MPELPASDYIGKGAGIKDTSFTYLDLFADNEQIMRLGRNVDKLENNYWKEKEEKLRKNMAQRTVCT